MKMTAEIKYGQLCIGSVVIPVDKDRDIYIDECYSLGQCAVYVEEIGIIPDVKIGRSIENYIEFPLTSDEFGSQLLFIRMPMYNNNYVAFDVLKKSDDVSMISENEFRIGKQMTNSGVNIIGNAETGTLLVNVKSDKKARVSITINGKELAEFNINVNGEIKNESDTVRTVINDSMIIEFPDNNDDKTVISYERGKGFNYLDEFDNKVIIKDGEVKILTKKINFGEGKEPLILGDTMKKLLDDFITQVSSILVTTSLGAMPILNKTQMEALKQRTGTILSELSNTD